MRWMRNSVPSGVWVVALLAVTALSETAQASTILKQAVEELARKSAVIARGRVVRAQSRWSGDGMRIITDVELAVSETLKGSPGARVRVTQPGGRVGDIAQTVSGLAAFSEGEEVLVFLGDPRGGRYLVEGAVQGKYRIDRGSDGGLLAIPESVRDVLFLDPKTRQPVAGESQPLAWTVLRAQIRRALQGQPGSSHP